MTPFTAMSPLHLTATMRIIKAHEGGRVTIAWAKRRVVDAARARAEKSADRDLLNRRECG